MTTEPKTPQSPKQPRQSREERLKAALKANMGRRKAHARERDAARDAIETGDQSPEEKE